MACASTVCAPDFFRPNKIGKSSIKNESTTSSATPRSGRLGEAPELIGAALLLLSPVAGSFITGEAIYVDGGFTAMTI